MAKIRQGHLILEKGKSVSFGSVGEYGIRDSTGVVEFKSEDGSWTPIGTGGGGESGTSGSSGSSGTSGSSGSSGSSGTSGEIEQRSVISIVTHPSDEEVVLQDGTSFWLVPTSANGQELTGVVCGVYSDGTTNTSIQVRRVRNSTEDDMLTTPLVISPGNYYADNPVIDITKDDIQTGDRIFIDVIEAGGSFGLVTTLTFL